jgi:hypothetical protein
MSDVARLEAEAAATRARLGETIGLLQDKLTVSGMVDEFIGQAAVPPISVGNGLVRDFVRRNPVPVLLAAAAIGFMIHRMNRRAAARIKDEDIEVPVLNTGHTRIYDPDLPSRHPLADGADAKRIEA